MSSAATALCMVSASSYPRRPVRAFAFPLFTTMADSLGESSLIIICTGAALTLLEVNALKAVAGTSEYRSPRSRERYLTPLCTPAALNP